MDQLFAEMKWQNLIDLLISNYLNEQDMDNTGHMVKKLVPYLNTFHPLSIYRLFELYIEKSAVNYEERKIFLQEIIAVLQRATKFTDDHEKILYFFRIIFLLNERKNGIHNDSDIHVFINDKYFTKLNNYNFLKIKYNSLLLDYYESENNFDYARNYAHNLNKMDLYILYTLISDNLYIIDMEIKNEELKLYYEKMMSGDFNFFINTKLPYKESLNKKILEKAYYNAIINFCYNKKTVSIEEISKTIGMDISQSLILIYKCMAQKYIYGKVNNTILKITGTKGNFDLHQLKEAFTAWKNNVQEMKELLMSKN